MADLLFGDFAVMAGPAMEEEQFRLPDDFSKAYFTFLSSLCDPASGFPAVFRVSQHGWTAVGRSRAQLLTQMRSKEIQPIFSLRGRDRRSLTAVMSKKISVVELKVLFGFKKASIYLILWPISCQSLIYCRICLFFKGLFNSA